MNNDVCIWQSDASPSHKIWLVPECDKDDFLVVSELFTDYPVYIIKQDSPLFSLAFIDFILPLSPKCNIQDINIQFLEEYEVAQALALTIDALKNYDINQAIQSIESISNLSKGKPVYDKLIFLLETITTINSIYFQNIISGSVYGLMTQKVWWHDKPYLFDVIELMTNECNKLPTAISKIIETKISDLKKIASILSSRNVEEIYKILSAFCYSYCRYFINNNDHMRAFLLIHRALDFYFVSDALTKGLIEAKRDHLKYHNQAYVSDESLPRIYLYKTYFDYISVTDKLDLASEDAIRSINKKRNELLLTHGVDAVGESEANDAYINAGKIMKKNQSWSEYLGLFRCRLVVDAKQLINKGYDIGDIISVINLTDC